MLLDDRDVQLSVKAGHIISILVQYIPKHIVFFE
jgi:hypothetical protein